MKPTIYDIARATDVSIATVSKVLNNTGRIGAVTRQRVLQAMSEMGYERNTLATALAGKNMYSIGLLLPDVNNPYFSGVVRGAEDAAFHRNYSLLICNTDNNQEKEQVYIKTLRAKRVDGIIIATGMTEPSTIKDLIEDGIEVVLLSRSIPDVHVPLITVDNFLGGYVAATHLLELGHREIAVLTEPLYIRSAKNRLEGFKQALHEAPFECSYTVYEGEGFGMSTGAKLTSQLLKEEPVTAVFAGTDQMAVGAMQVCREAGKTVPDDISILGFDDTSWARIVDPPLSTVAQPMYLLGQLATDRIIHRIEVGDRRHDPLVLTPRLVVRGSTKAPRALRAGEWL
ncbi:MAG: hypothetical protein A2201_01060 [Alicyclobacillus sp. RIFOXYA1_FULL_53_8]|nr:MAG: hypothetical protein A2201_01060 [Alicyclobacillus sp. RIFOXYA1_FULL_53_8]